ncbi:hypothetical protein FGLOB1_5747 [Fusarium globosum]|uniref:Uncharacterized protein n=1 Tax=Fusarium globosum TaxID=78864 RepID=A0A8H5YC49_9HYPO|nr:hypothetical protein FGLOB1_5747 [Fusarium globosum]
MNDAEAQDSVNERAMKEARSGLQMDNRSDTGEIAANTSIGMVEQEKSSQSQASGSSSPTSGGQPALGAEDVAGQSEGVGEVVNTQVQPEASPDMSEGQQAVESEDVIMGESESADGLAPSHSLEGNDDDTAHHTTPEPTTLWLCFGSHHMARQLHWFFFVTTSTLTFPLRVSRWSVTYDNKAYTVGFTYQDGQLKMYASHFIEPFVPEKKPGIAMTQLKALALTDDPDTFRQGATAYRNGRD